MPLYDFECTDCQTIEDRLVSYTDINNQTCQKCGKALVQNYTNKNFYVSTAGCSAASLRKPH